jgi:hypothetical protein
MNMRARVELQQFRPPPPLFPQAALKKQKFSQRGNPKNSI